MIPIHATLTLGDSLPPDHFSPGGGDKPARHVTAYWGGKTVETATRYHFERAGLGAPWVLRARIQGDSGESIWWPGFPGGVK